MIHHSTSWRWVIACAFLPLCLRAQPYGEPDRGEPGDPMIQRYLAAEAAKIERQVFPGVKTQAAWDEQRAEFKKQYFHMLGLWPLPEKTPLQATVTRTLDRGDYLVEMIHYQSRPGLFVTGNLYRPARAAAGQKLPAILYVCGHSGRGRNGNKTAFQSHGIWFARHGYVCLVVDTLQLGEIPGVHHGTYREGRWWWLSRGYTPAGVECWSGIRGIDYLISRPDVDPGRIGVTGISGGGAATFWIAAADDRVKVAAPVSGMADLESYVSNRVINGHCDCMFLYNTYQWHWTQIAALIAPRPQLFVNSDQDAIFPMDANERVINRLERFYSVFGASELVDSLVSIGGHDYRKDIRQGVYRFMNLFLKNDPAPVTDSEHDLVTGPGESISPISPEDLRVFPKDTDLPATAMNGRIDETFVPRAAVARPTPESFSNWKTSTLRQLREVTFHHFPDAIPAASEAATAGAAHTGPLTLNTEPGITVSLQQVQKAEGNTPNRVVLLVGDERTEALAPEWLRPLTSPRDTVYVCIPRGTRHLRWTLKNPPNYVARSHYLLGRTVASGRVWDVAAVAAYLARSISGNPPVWVAGAKEAGVAAVYAALLEPTIAGLLLNNVPMTHMDPAAPALLNVLRVCDVPEALGLVAPRPVTVTGAGVERLENTAALYRSAGAEGKFTLVP